MMRILFLCFLFLAQLQAFAQDEVRIRKKDRKKDVMMITDSGTIILRLSDSTPLHRDNFIRLVKKGFYDSIAFHRVIRNFMIQAGNPLTKRPNGADDAGYTLPAEIRPSLFHKKGALAAARMGDDVNPEKRSSGSQFYIVQGKVFTPAGLDSVETFRLKGRKLPPAHREVYQTLGGAPHLDQNYTVFGEVVSGLEVVDKIAATKTTGREGADKPLTDIRIVKVSLVKRKVRSEK
ncbi:MAG TPA: peptidylprolyl isomerase [Chitinophagaceae bacterium]|nr:peptidylprolyl isomerase [Chitinophagaceae bacterium]